MFPDNKISATIIADSKNTFGQRVTTFVLCFPRMILAELNTHRAFSRNSASSRAVPFRKMLQRVKDSPFIPMAWMKEHTGMQGSEYLTGDRADAALAHWLGARTEAMDWASSMSDLGVSKQICNRLLEPFMWHTAIVTATDWGNFFALRAHEAAEIHFQALANAMLDAYNKSEPLQLEPGEWHIPFSNSIDADRIAEAADNAGIFAHKAKIKVAIARCARVSYLNFEGADDYDADIKLADRLATMGHMSPFEHVARAMTQDEYLDHSHYNLEQGVMINGVCGNFTGFIQYRKLLANENRFDNRLIDKA